MTVVRGQGEGGGPLVVDLVYVAVEGLVVSQPVTGVEQDLVHSREPEDMKTDGPVGGQLYVVLPQPEAIVRVDRDEGQEVTDREEDQDLDGDERGEEFGKSGGVEVLVGLDLVLVQRSPAGEVDQEVEEAVEPVDRHHQAGDHQAGEREGGVGGCEVRPPGGEEGRPYHEG